MRTAQKSLFGRFAPFALALLITAGAQAANVSSTLTLNGTTTISGAGYVNAGQVTLDAKFIEDLGADSLDRVELVMALEEEFGNEIPDEQAEKLQSVGDVIKYIEDLQQK